MRCLYDGEHPCGRCPSCLANRQRAFMYRLDQEKDHCSFYFWLTLQYDDEHVPRLSDGEMCFSKEHCHKFFEKLRSRYKERFYFKHFLVSEYGPNSTHRPHYHCLLLCYDQSPSSISQRYEDRHEIRKFLIEKAWPHGHVTEKSFHGRVLRYLTKYCLKPELLGQKHTMKPFTLISRGIGLSYLDSIPEEQKQQMIKDLNFTVRYGSGHLSLPRYYVDKLVPHSLEDLQKLIPEDVENEESWIPYREMQDLRERLQDQHNKQVFNRAKNQLRKDVSIGAIGQDIRHRDRVISTSWNNFISVSKSRKDL